MNKNRISTLIFLVLFVLSGGATACSPADSENNTVVPADKDRPPAAKSIGPNSALPEVAPPTQICAQMDKVFSAALGESTPGKNFVAAQAEKVSSEDSAATKAREEQVQKTWIAFLEYFKKEKMPALEAAAGSDKDGKRVAVALNSYIANAPALLRGEIPQFTDEKAAYEDLTAGRQPKVNPEYTRISTKTGADIELISSCLPTWPLIF